MFKAGNNSKLLKRRIIKYFEDNNIDLNNKTLIDLGCGDCNTTKYYISKGAKVIAVDNYKDKFVIKRDLNKNFNINKKFDYVISLATIEHLENPYHFFREVKKLMKKDSIFIVCTHNINHYWSKLYFLLFNINLSFDWNKNIEHYKKHGEVSHFTNYNKEHLKFVGKVTGLKFKEMFYGNSMIKLIPYVLELKKYVPEIEPLSMEFFIVFQRV